MKVEKEREERAESTWMCYSTMFAKVQEGRRSVLRSRDSSTKRLRWRVIGAVRL